MTESKMSDGKKIMLWWVGIMVVLGIAAAIRMAVLPPESSPPVHDPWEDWAKTSTPECARIIREESARLNHEHSAADAENRVFWAEYVRIERSNLPESEKQIRLRRLVAQSNMKETSQEANSDVAFMRTTQRLKEAGCLEK